jgi:hypothetical protein
MAVTFVPLAGAAFEKLIGVLPKTPATVGLFQEFDWWFFVLALATIAAGLVAFATVRFHFLFWVVTGATFIAFAQLVPAALDHPSAADDASGLVVIGAVLLAIGIALDLRNARRAAFWWHLDGLVALALGLAYHAFRHSSWGWILILVAGSLLLLLAASLDRATWGIFGVAGFFAPIAHYLDVWLGHLGVAFAVALFGLGLIAIGLAVRRYGHLVLERLIALRAS